VLPRGIDIGKRISSVALPKMPCFRFLEFDGGASSLLRAATHFT